MGVCSISLAPSTLGCWSPAGALLAPQPVSIHLTLPAYSICCKGVGGGKEGSVSGWRLETKKNMQRACTVQKQSKRRPLTDHSRAELARRRCHVAAAGCHWPPACCSACITGANRLRGLCRGRHPAPSQRRMCQPGTRQTSQWALAGA